MLLRDSDSKNLAKKVRPVSARMLAANFGPPAAGLQCEIDRVAATEGSDEQADCGSCSVIVGLDIGSRRRQRDHI
jgi:hypothetical protein